VPRAVFKQGRALDASSREARLDVGPSKIALRVEPGPDGIDAVRAVEVEVDTPQIDAKGWAGDAAASYALEQGRTLWTQAFSGALGLALGQAAKNAAAADQSLTVRVVADPEIPDERRWLPWELLVDPDQGTFLALAPGWSVVRGTVSAEPTRPLPSDRPLRIVVASMLYLDQAPQEWRTSFEHAAEEASWLGQLSSDSAGRCKVQVATDPDRPELLELLRTSDADVVHLIGTGVAGGMGVRDPESPIPFPYTGAVGMREIGLPTPLVSDGEMAMALGQNPGVGLVVLNGCDLEPMAEAVNLATGATVLAHRGRVEDVHATKLTQAFYPMLLDGKRIDVAIAETRRQLEFQFPGQAPWASTVLFTGWPPTRFVPPHQPDDPSSFSFDSPASRERTSVASAAELIRLMHEANLASVRKLPHQSWSPIAAQAATAARGTEGP
jgi:CHAT domain